MKVYFATGYENPKMSLKNIDEILQILQKEGHKIVRRPLKAEHGSSVYKVDEAKFSHIFDFLNKPLDQIYTEATSRIRNSDIVIIEASYHVSPGLGFELGYALNERKPVLVLVHKSSDIVLSEVIEGNPSKLFYTEKYNDAEDLKKVVTNFIKDAQSKMDTKFILIISPEIDKYLEWASSERRQHKAQIVRNAVESSMLKDKEYKEFLKGVNAA